MKLSEKEIDKVQRHWLTCFVEIADVLDIRITDLSSDPFTLARKFLSGEIGEEELEMMNKEVIRLFENEPRFWDTSIARLWPARLAGIISGLGIYIRCCDTDNILVSFEVTLTELEMGLGALGYDSKKVSEIVDSYWREWPYRNAIS